MNINERIIAKMKELGMKQVDLARQTGATKGAVNQWFKGSTAPSGENLIKVANALGVSPEWLQTGKDPRPHGGVVINGDNALPPPANPDIDPQDLMIMEILKDLTPDQKAEALRTLENQKQANLAIYETIHKRKAS